MEGRELDRSTTERDGAQTYWHTEFRLEDIIIFFKVVGGYMTMTSNVIYLLFKFSYLW